MFTHFWSEYKRGALLNHSFLIPLLHCHVILIDTNGDYGSGIEGSIPVEFMNMSALEVALLCK